MPTPASGVQLFDSASLQLGDVVLERGSGVVSAAVAGATNGHYSHALMWVGGGNFIEAMPDGVRSLSVVRVPVVQRRNWRLLRVAAEHQALAASAANVARNLAFSAYDKVGAIRSVMAPRAYPKPSYRFCSQLVAEAYEAVGLPLFSVRAPGEVYPNILLESSHLHVISLPLVPAHVLFNEPYPPEMLDRSRAFRGSAMAEEGDIAREIFDAIAPLLKNALVPPPFTEMQFEVLNDVLSLLPLLPPPDGGPIADRLLEEMNTRKYFDLLVPLLARFWFDVKPSPWWKAHEDLWRETRDRHRLNAQCCLEASQRMPHPLWTKLQMMYTLHAAAFDGLLEKVA
jgi:hypothetical protein